MAISTENLWRNTIRRIHRWEKPTDLRILPEITHYNHYPFFSAFTRLWITNVHWHISKEEATELLIRQRILLDLSRNNIAVGSSIFNNSQENLRFPVGEHDIIDFFLYVISETCFPSALKAFQQTPARFEIRVWEVSVYHVELQKRKINPAQITSILHFPLF